MKITYVYIGLVVLIVAGLLVLRTHSTKTVTPAAATAIDSFADCLGKAGAKFYGAFWCPHCKEQKELFQNSTHLSSVYVECSTPDQSGQTKVCKDAGITGYPTWIFADGSKADGVQQFADLGAKTKCPVPQT